MISLILSSCFQNKSNHLFNLLHFFIPAENFLGPEHKFLEVEIFSFPFRASTLMILFTHHALLSASACDCSQGTQVYNALTTVHYWSHLMSFSDLGGKRCVEIILHLTFKFLVLTLIGAGAPATICIIFMCFIFIHTLSCLSAMRAPSPPLCSVKHWIHVTKSETVVSSWQTQNTVGNLAPTTFLRKWVNWGCFQTLYFF